MLLIDYCLLIYVYNIVHRTAFVACNHYLVYPIMMYSLYFIHEDFHLPIPYDNDTHQGMLPKTIRI